MKYKCAMAVVQTRRKTPYGNIDEQFMVFTDSYRKKRPVDYKYEGYVCDNFNILEKENGDVVILTEGVMKFSGTKIDNVITVKNCRKIQVWSLEGGLGMESNGNST